MAQIDELSQYSESELYDLYSDEELDDILSEYYEIMDITEEQKEKRKQLAKELRNALLFLFALMRVSYENDYLEFEFVLNQFRIEFTKVVINYGRVDVYFEQYITKVTRDIVDTTFKYADLTQPNFWLSDKRAVDIAENESNSVLNYEELQEAIDDGYTMKTWLAEIDNRTRKDHKEMNNKTIPINEMFVFPDCKMMFAHDEVNGTAAQCSNCRCSMKYS